MPFVLFLEQWGLGQLGAIGGPDFFPNSIYTGIYLPTFREGTNFIAPKASAEGACIFSKLVTVERV